MHPLSRDAHSHTHRSGVLSYASPSILSMPLHADLAAAIALNHNVGTKFTLTVTAGGIAVKHAPFGAKGKEAKWQLNKTFWKVRTPYGHRRTLFVVAHASETCSTKPNVVFEDEDRGGLHGASQGRQDGTMKFIQRDKIHPDRNPKSPILGKHTISVQTRLESPKAPNHMNALRLLAKRTRKSLVQGHHACYRENNCSVCQ